MGQFNSRLFVMVKGVSVWKKLKDVPLKKYGIDAEAEEVFDSKKKSIIFEDFSCEDDKLLGLIKEIAKRIKTDGFAISDTTNYNVDPYIFGAYCFGGKAHSFVIEGNDERTALQNEVNIDEPQKWIEYSLCEVSKKEVSFLKDYSIKAKAYKPETESKYVCKIIVTNVQNGDIKESLKNVPYLNQEKDLYEVITSQMGKLMNGEVHEDISTASIVIPIMTEVDIREYTEKVKAISETKVSICAWNGKDTDVHVWKCINGAIEEIVVDEKHNISEMKGYLYFDDPGSFDDLVDLKKYIDL